MRDAKLLPNLAQIARDFALVLHHARAADHLQSAILARSVRIFVCMPRQKRCALLVVGEVFEWEEQLTLFPESPDKGDCVSRQSVGLPSCRGARKAWGKRGAAHEKTKGRL